MTKIQIFKNNNLIVGFEISGHTMSAMHGQDVLCSAISAISQSTCLGILDVLKLKADLQKNDKKGFLKCDLQKLGAKQIESAQVLLKTMQKSLEDIAIGNEKYMKVEVYDEIY